MNLNPGVKIATGNRTYKGSIPDEELEKTGLKKEDISKLKKKTVKKDNSTENKGKK